MKLDHRVCTRSRDVGGEPHFLEDPSARVEDVRAAVDHLQSLDYVDADRVGALGICAGGAYAVTATMTDHRIKAVTTASALSIGDGYRQGWFGADPVTAAVPTPETAAQQRTAETQGAAADFSTVGAAVVVAGRGAGGGPRTSVDGALQGRFRQRRTAGRCAGR
ncbi:dienelactone hydrolase family protein [Pseudonocardia tropica]|uniref:Dienelactone hydrolase family protein n=2 Tax=Pseudonocardia tropica TaxID=681289 RepID=A0ABV1JXP6_9PSEU